MLEFDAILMVALIHKLSTAQHQSGAEMDMWSHLLLSGYEYVPCFVKWQLVMIMRKLSGTPVDQGL